MGEVRQLVQFVRHTGQCAERMHYILRHGFFDIDVASS